MSETTTKQKWTEELTEQLLNVIGEECPVTKATVQSAAQELDMSDRRIAAKLRKLGIEVESLAKSKTASFTDDEGDALEELLETNAGELTYKEVAAVFCNGKFTPKQIQGKVLALELTGSIKPTDKLEVAAKYTPEEEDKFVSMANAGKYVEEIAEALNKTIMSVRGKALSLTQEGYIDKIPAQKVSLAKDSKDILDGLNNLAEMTVVAIAEATDRTERGIKTLLTRRGIKVADYDGQAKHEKAEGKREAAQASAV